MWVAYLYNIFAVAVMAYLAVIFEKWWVILFALLFIHGVKITKTNVEDNEDDGE